TRAVDREQSPTKLRAFITPEGSTKVLVEKITDYAADAPTQDIELSVKDLPVDRQYKVVLEVLGSGGQVITSVTAVQKRPADPDWWVHRDEYGSKPEVPEPWTPITWRQGVAGVWGRDITLDDALFPEQINSQAKDILAGPMRLE